MARDEGIALAPWDVLAHGKIRSDAEEERRRKTGEKGRTYSSQNWGRTEQEKQVCRALEKVAAEVGIKSINAVAIAVEHLVENIEALEVTLTDEHLKSLDSVVPLDLGFPHNMIGNGTSVGLFNSSNGHIAYWPVAKPVSTPRFNL